MPDIQFIDNYLVEEDRANDELVVSHDNGEEWRFDATGGLKASSIEVNEFKNSTDVIGQDELDHSVERVWTGNQQIRKTTPKLSLTRDGETDYSYISFDEADGTQNFRIQHNNSHLAIKDQEAGGHPLIINKWGGPIEVNNANLNLNENNINDISILSFRDGNSGRIFFDRAKEGNPLHFQRESSGSDTYLSITPEDNVRVRNVDLKIDTYNSIIDDNNVERLSIGWNNTILKDENGNTRFAAVGGGPTQIRTDSSGGGIRLMDEEGSFTAAEYYSSPSSPGTLELTNADLKLPSTHIKLGRNERIEFGDGNDLTTLGNIDFPDVETETAKLRIFRGTNTTGTSEIGIFKADGTSSQSLLFNAKSSSVQFGDNAEPVLGSNMEAGLYMDNGELKVKFSNGTITTIATE